MRAPSGSLWRLAGRSAQVAHSPRAPRGRQRRLPPRARAHARAGGRSLLRRAREDPQGHHPRPARCATQAEDQGCELDDRQADQERRLRHLAVRRDGRLLGRISEGTVGSTWLRGVQLTDANGLAEFDDDLPRPLSGPHDSHPRQGPHRREGRAHGVLGRPRLAHRAVVVRRRDQHPGVQLSPYTRIRRPVSSTPPITSTPTSMARKCYSGSRHSARASPTAYLGTITLGVNPASTPAPIGATSSGTGGGPSGGPTGGPGG